MERRYVTLVITIVVVAFVASLALFGWWYTIDQGERGVVLRNGAVIGTAEPGFHIKTPWIDEVAKVSVQSHVWTATLPTYSRDQQPADLRLSVNFRAVPTEVAAIYGSYGSLDGLVTRLIMPRATQATKTVFGSFNAVTAIAERNRLNLEVFDAIGKAVEGPVVIESVQLEDITFSDAYEASIEQRMLAEVEVQKIRQNAEREKIQAEIHVIQAEAEANAVRAKAAAEADAIRLRGEAEASAIEARAAALSQNENLVELVRAERWNGVLPTTMLPNGAVPFLSR